MKAEFNLIIRKKIDCWIIDGAKGLDFELVHIREISICYDNPKFMKIHLDSFLTTNKLKLNCKYEGRIL